MGKWYEVFTPSSDVDDRRPGSRITEVRPTTAVKKGPAVAGIGIAFVSALTLGYCGRPHVETPPPPAEIAIKVPADEAGKFVGYVFGDMERVWAETLGPKWRRPKLTLYTASTATKGGDIVLAKPKMLQFGG